MTTPKARQGIDVFTDNPGVAVAVRRYPRRWPEPQVASNIGAAELSWTYAYNRGHRPATSSARANLNVARIIAVQTIDARVAELIGQQGGAGQPASDGYVISARLRQPDARVVLLTDAAASMVWPAAAMRSTYWNIALVRSRTPIVPLLPWLLPRPRLPPQSATMERTTSGR